MVGHPQDPALLRLTLAACGQPNALIYPRFGNFNRNPELACLSGLRRQCCPNRSQMVKATVPASLIQRLAGIFVALGGHRCISVRC
ncbi:hypothetical protein Poly51_53530 [Rubripirellula tenax]|uniref:Uncharacterized protein n=1 Tax=Rubripirellula tenax TaxID=2528015 RepID=A0A5C6ECT3_9BACT|nr:hypothetical protein Poly51_53530 [Rubripirellula tenax]